MAVMLTTLEVSALLTAAGLPPDVLATRNSSLLLEPLPDCAPVCEETDKGLESGMGLLTGTPSPPAANVNLGAWTLGTATLEAADKSFLAINMIACAWRKMASSEMHAPLQT